MARRLNRLYYWSALALALMVLTMWWLIYRTGHVKITDQRSKLAVAEVHLQLPPSTEPRGAHTATMHAGAPSAVEPSTPSQVPAKVTTNPAHAPSPVALSASTQPTVAAGASIATPAPVEKAAAVSKSHPSSLPGTTCERAGWYAQLGAFGRLSQAAPLADRLQQNHYHVCIGNLAGSNLYRVLIGPAPGRQEAAELAARVQKDKLTKSLGYPQYWAPPTP